MVLMGSKGKDEDNLHIFQALKQIINPTPQIATKLEPLIVLGSSKTSSFKSERKKLKSSRMAH
jgi:hypothetical protein